MTTGLPVSTFVRIQTEISAGGVLRTQFGTGLLVTKDDAIAAGGTGKMVAFADLDSARAAGVSGEALRAAGVWFGGDPDPHSLYIGRWADTAVGTTLEGTAPAALASFTGANNRFVLNGTETGPIDFSTAPAALADVAAAVETAIQALGGVFVGADFTYDALANSGSGGFTLTLATGAAIDPPRFEAATTMGATDLSALLGFTAPVYMQGSAAETLQEAIAAMLPLAVAGEPVLPMVAGDVPETIGGDDTRRSLAEFIQGGDYFAFIRDNDVDTLVTGETASFSAHVFAEQLSHVEPVVGAGTNFGADTTTYPDVAANALLSSQRFNLPASIRNPHLKTLPGAVPINIDATQLAELRRKRTSVYTTVGGIPSLAGGFTGQAGAWADAQYWLLWLKNEMELNIFNAQKASAFFSTPILIDTLDQVRAVATRSGGLQPGGRVNAGVRQRIRQTFNDPTFDGILPNGWLQWVERPSARSDLDRSNRIGRVQVFIAGADAINEVVGSVVFSS